MTSPDGTLLLWRFELADGLRLHVWPNGAALSVPPGWRLAQDADGLYLAAPAAPQDDDESGN